MSITTYCVNNLNEAVQRVEIKPQSPFEMNTVVYQNAGLKELLTFDLTKRLGITANLKFSTLQQWINELAVSIGHESEQEPLVWKILSILKKLNLNQYPELESYLEDELRAVQLAEKLASIFDDYESYQFHDIKGWQKEVRDQLTVDDFQSGAVEHITKKASKVQLKTKFNIIGLDFITPIQFKFLNAIRDVANIQFYFVYPAKEKVDAVSDYWVLKNKVLDQLQELGEVNFPKQETERNTVLKSLQNEDLTNRESDTSVSIVNAYSKKREVQELYNFILYQCQFNQIKPYEVQVLCPNIGDYQPYIDAVFQSDEFPVKLPYHISDVPKPGFTQKIDLILKSLSVSDNISLKEVSTYLENRSVQKKYNISDYSNAIEYLKRTAFVIGNVEDEDNELSLIGWPQAKKRLVYGLTMYTNKLYDRVLPFDEAEGQCAFEIMGVIDLVDDLFTWSKENISKSFNDWFDIFAERYHLFFGKNDDEVNPEDHHIWPFFEGLYDSINSITAQTFSYIVSNQISSYGKNKKRFTNGITISELSSNRSISRKITCVIGLNDQSFPRKEAELEIDQLKGLGIRPQKKQVDKLDYISAIMSADEKLFLSFTGTNTKNNTKLLPSIFLSETIEQVKEITGEKEDDLVVKHPANHQAAFYSNIENEPFSFIKTPKLSEPSNDKSEPSDSMVKSNSISLNELIDYFKNPSKWYYKNVLKISLFDKDEAVAENESFEVAKGLGDWAIRNDYLTGLDQKNQDLILEEKQSLKLPLGGYGDAKFENEINKIQELKNALIKQFESGVVELENPTLMVGDIEVYGEDINFIKNDETNCLIYWCNKEVKNVNEAKGELSNKIIELTLIGAFLAAKGILVQVRYFFTLPKGEVDFLSFNFSDMKASAKWLSKMVELYQNQPEDHPIHFYPKLYWTNIDEIQAPLDAIQKHFENEDGKQYPNEYQQKAYLKSLVDYDEEIHQKYVQSDWVSYGRFFEILN